MKYYTIETSDNYTNDKFIYTVTEDQIKLINTDVFYNIKEIQKEEYCEYDFIELCITWPIHLKIEKQTLKVIRQCYNPYHEKRIKA